jgi:putative transposase
MAHTFTSLLTHVVFSTKDRYPHIDAEVRERLFPYMGGILREIGATPVTINGVKDHVHGLVALPATLSVADAMRVLKTNSSRWVHQEWPRLRAFAWQTGYGAFSVSRSNAEDVERYIARQEEHHRTVTFQEEFVAFLKRHGIAYDERYVWE